MSHTLHEQNRLSWNAATAAHNSHKGDQAQALRAGHSTLFPEELELLGSVAGQELLHLQCNAGQDTLSLVQLGARATGVDISDEAIESAAQLSAESGLLATFVRADVYDYLGAGLQAAFDVVFCSYGAICWLSDLTLWAQGISRALRSGGRLVTVEFHPAAMMFDEQLQRKYPYFGGGQPLTWAEGVNDYVARSGAGLLLGTWREGVQDFRNPHAVHEFPWSLGEIVTALCRAGLVLEELREYPYSNGFRMYDEMRLLEGRRFYLPEGQPALPMMYGLRARKP